MRTNKKLYLAGATLCLLLAGPAVFAQNAVYRWVGEDGGVNYGATPPAGVEAVLVKAGGPSVGGGDEASASSPAGSSEETAEQEAPKPQLSPEMQARKEAMCKEERQRLATLQKPGRIRMQQPDGSTKYLSIEEVQAEINTTQKVIADTCN